MSEVIPGAEAFEADGGPVGVLVVHGFTGSPQTVRPLGEALADAGFSVSLPRLPGHGTSLEDMATTGFEDWSAAVEEAYASLSARSEHVVVAGLSMGGTLTCWLAARHPEVAGIVCINPAVEPQPPEVLEMVRLMLDGGETVSAGVGSDIADPEGRELAYDGSPLAPALSLFRAIEALQADLGRITCPVLIMTSAEDHVVAPSSSDHLAGSVSGPVERVTLERSYHVATLDHDKQLVAERTVEFARKVTAG